tara:strand:- start:428 stop:673 length:246 start_codon:yes stop_codon:yes gene_type:complete
MNEKIVIDEDSGKAYKFVLVDEDAGDVDVFVSPLKDNGESADDWQQVKFDELQTGVLELVAGYHIELLIDELTEVYDLLNE